MTTLSKDPDRAADFARRCEQAARLPLAPVTTDWVLVEQRLVDQFAQATLDPDPAHIDLTWSKAHMPYGGTIAQGLWGLAVAVHLMQESGLLKPVEAALGAAYGLNYGYERVRFIEPLIVGRRVRARIEPKTRERRAKGGLLVTVALTLEIEGNERPALVADWSVLYPPPSA